jgi:hypothetical protein
VVARGRARTKTETASRVCFPFRERTNVANNGGRTCKRDSVVTDDATTEGGGIDRSRRETMFAKGSGWITRISKEIIRSVWLQLTSDKGVSSAPEPQRDPNQRSIGDELLRARAYVQELGSGLTEPNSLPSTSGGVGGFGKALQQKRTRNSPSFLPNYHRNTGGRISQIRSWGFPISVRAPVAFSNVVRA